MVTPKHAHVYDQTSLFVTILRFLSTQVRADWPADRPQASCSTSVATRVNRVRARSSSPGRFTSSVAGARAPWSPSTARQSSRPCSQSIYSVRDVVHVRALVLPIRHGPRHHDAARVRLAPRWRAVFLDNPRTLEEGIAFSEKVLKDSRRGFLRAEVKNIRTLDVLWKSAPVLRPTGVR